jgi:PBP1b-binding outer membrane lipoprotein LpoB
MKYLLIITSALFLTSCVSQKACDKKFPPETRVKDSTIVTYKDSTVIKEKRVLVVKDSIRYTEAVKDSGEVSANENQTYRFKNENASITIKIKDGKVKWNIDISAIEQKYSTKLDSINSVVKQYQYKDSLVQSHTEIVRKIIPKEPWYIKTWHKIRDFFALIGIFLLLYIIIVNGVKIMFRV